MGDEGYSKYLNDLFVFDTSTQEWVRPIMHGDVPSPRAWHSQHVFGNNIMIFGGTAGRRDFYDELYILVTEEMTWYKIETAGEEKPTGRCSHTMTAIGSNLFVFGGLAPAIPDNKIGPTNDAFTLITGLSQFASPSDPVVDPPQENTTSNATHRSSDVGSTLAEGSGEESEAERTHRASESGEKAGGEKEGEKVEAKSAS